MTTAAHARGTSERGSGLLLALVLTTAMFGIGMSVLLLASTERLLSNHHRAGVAAVYAAESLAELAVQELSTDVDWTPAVQGARQSAFLTAGSTAASPWNEPVDLGARTAAVQLESETIWAAGFDTPQWRLFAAGSLSALIGNAFAGPFFLIAFVADDPADGDADPSADSNGTILLRVEALGHAGLRRVLLLTIKRDGTGVSRVTAWRELR